MLRRPKHPTIEVVVPKEEERPANMYSFSSTLGKICSIFMLIRLHFCMLCVELLYLPKYKFIFSTSLCAKWRFTCNHIHSSIVCIFLYVNVVKGTILYSDKYDIKSLTC